MKKLFVSIFCAILPLLAIAQNMRVVNGIVFDENGGPKSNVMITAEGGANTVSKSDGIFLIEVSPYAKFVKASCEGYIDASAEIDGSYIVFRMKVDKKYAGLKAKQEQARLEAERLAREQAEAERIAAAKKAEAERLAAEKKAKIRAIDEKYNKQYRNKGIVHSFELSYGYQLYNGDVVYENSGYRNYSSLHPVGLTYTFSYRFSNWFSLGLGTGVLYNLVNLGAYADAFDKKYVNIEKFSAINIPVFANAKVYMSRGRVQPLISLSGGVYAPNLELMCDCGLGCNFRLSKRANLYVLASFVITPGARFYEYSNQNWSYNRILISTPSFKVGFTF